MKKNYRYFVMAILLGAVVSTEATAHIPDATDINMADTYPMRVGACKGGAKPTPQTYKPNEINSCPDHTIFVGIQYDKNSVPVNILCASADQCIGPDLAQGPVSIDHP